MNEDNKDLDLFAQQQGGDGTQQGASLFGGSPFDLGSAGGDFKDPFAEPAVQEGGQTAGAANAQNGVTLTFPSAAAAPAASAATPTHAPAAPAAEIPPAPAAAPAAAQTPSETPAENPLAAAMEQVDETNARKAVGPVMAQLPVFSYNGVTEDIQDVAMTFDQLRESKVDDFPELGAPRFPISL